VTRRGQRATPAATRNSVENLDLLHSVRTIEVGKLADLLLVDGDARVDIEAMSRVVVVIKDGTVYRDDTAPGGSHGCPGWLD